MKYVCACINKDRQADKDTEKQRDKCDMNVRI